MVATNNKHKLSEISEIIDTVLPKGSIELYSSADFGKKILPDEIGTSYYENAEIKANAFFEEFGLPTIADDSGLEIDAINGEPGIFSSSFAGEEGNHKKNRDKAVAIISKVPEQARTARFRTIFCYIDSSQKFFVEGTVEGRLIEEERGDGGFGYDPIFIPIGYDITFSQMSSENKNNISHRANALRNLIAELKKRNLL